MKFKDNSSPGMGVIHKVLLDDNEAVLHCLGASTIRLRLARSGRPEVVRAMKMKGVKITHLLEPGRRKGSVGLGIPRVGITLQPAKYVPGILSLLELHDLTGQSES
jgi:hypothetical protein